LVGLSGSRIGVKYFDMDELDILISDIIEARRQTNHWDYLDLFNAWCFWNYELA